MDTHDPPPVSRTLYRRGAWGRLALALVPLVAVTGVMLAFVYRPDPAAAWASVATISGGALAVFRDLHRWGSDLLVVAAWLHLFRVFVVGAYRRLPGWGLSVALTLLIVLAAASGRLLRFDAGAARLLDGTSLHAVYALHVLILPATALLVVGRVRSKRTELSAPEPAMEVAAPGEEAEGEEE